MTLHAPTGTTAVSNLMHRHVTVGRGAAHDADGQRLIGPQWTGSGGPGRAKCSCGEVSEELPARRARHKWLREHIAALAADLSAQDEPSEEEWREVSLDPRYAVSSLGRVRGARGFLLSQARDSDGYLLVTVGSNPKSKVHQLVCTAFHGPRPSPAHEVAHGNGVRDDNRAENLRWATRSENSLDSVKHGTCSGLKRRSGEGNSHARFTWEQVDAIRDLSASGMSNAEIGELYGVTPGSSAIRNIVSGATWRDEDRPAARDMTEYHRPEESESA